jgi:hypothetical protein
VPANVRADLIKSTVKWAGYEPKEARDTGPAKPTFMIQMNLNGAQTPTMKVIDNEE